MSKYKALAGRHKNILRACFYGGAVAGLLASATWAQAPAPVRPDYGAPLTLEEAKMLVDAGEAAAKAIHSSSAIAIVEPTGDLILLHKMDGTQYSAADIALAKARSSARFRRPTKEFEDGLAGGRNAILGIPGAVPIAGGVMVLRGGKLVGAVGVSGGAAAQDNQIAEAAAKALH